MRLAKGQTFIESNYWACAEHPCAAF